MKSNKRLEDYMLEGIKKAYTQTQYFAFDWNVLLKNLREYHITIEVARSIKEMIEKNSSPNLKIVLEANTKLVESNCIEANRIEGDDIFSMYIPDKKIEGKVSRKGFVDITVFEETKNFELQTKYAIEIKSINTSWGGIKKDFERLSELVTKKDIKGNHENTLDGCYQLFVKQTNGVSITQNPEMINNWKSDTKKKIEKYFEKWAIEFGKDVDIAVLDKEITSISQDKIPSELECDFHDLLERTGVVMAYCVKITNK
ncbi:MAG: hypothetical protein N4A35_02870 [Flavobacteriales bacterium]|jgi:hypothetical protein|nr:hypothetical protein [Flavobacteriales bacterium]